MKKITFLFLFFFLISLGTFAQNAADGISLKGLNTNRESFYFGEPLSLAFELKNNTQFQKEYWRKAIGVNVYYRLINLKNNKEVGNSEHDWRTFVNIRDRYSSSAPDEKSSFQPDHAYYFIVNLAGDLNGPLFQTYGQNLKYKNVLSLDLTTLPEGDYKLVVEFYLFPSNQKISTEHPFAIKRLPGNERDAYQAFLESTVYAANSYYPGDNNYLPYSEKSYERFIEEYPESLFAEYAYFNLIDAVYHYGGTKTIPKSIRQQKVKEYLSNKNFKLSNLKVKKAQKLPHVVGWAENVDKYKILEQQLEVLKNEDPVISDLLIRKSKDKHKIKGLKNRARGE